jgi:CheY-like chemotaxis protein
MRALLVEDDENKRAQILRLVREGWPEAEIETAGSYRGGLDRIQNRQFDLVLLDMTMPTYDIDFDEEGGRPRAFAGRDILRQMERRGIAAPVVVVTQFDKFGEGGETKTRDQLDRELAAAHPSNYRGMVYYNTALEGWKEELTRKVEALRVG